MAARQGPAPNRRSSRSSVRPPRARPRPDRSSRNASAPRSSRSTRCSSTGGWTSARPSRPRSSGRGSRTTSSTSPSRPSRSASLRYQELAREAVAEYRSRRRRVLLVGGSALYERAVVDDLDFPGTDPDTRRDLEAEAAVVGAAGLHERLAASDPTAAAKIEPGNVRRTVRALEVAELTGRPFSSFGEGWDVYEPDRVRAAGISMPAPVLRTQDRGPRRRDARTRVARRGARARGARVRCLAHFGPGHRVR